MRAHFATALALLEASLLPVVPPHWMREKVKVRNAGGREVEVPRCCPIPGHLIESTWCDWADGWYIHLIKGLPVKGIRETSGELQEDHRHSHGWLDGLRAGWHAYDDKNKRILACAELEPCEWPGSDKLYRLWAGLLTGLDDLAAASDRG